MFTDTIILAGGYGERLWPASSPSKPKQFMSLEGGISFLQSSILRALSLDNGGKILVITRIDLLELMIEHCKEFADQLDDKQKKILCDSLYIIAEPIARHTASPIALACRFLEKINPSVKHSLLVLTSDHVIYPMANFIADVGKAYEAASQGYFVCFAIHPTEPATGYGYIKTGGKLNYFEGEEIYSISSFKEKPNLTTARQYLESGEYWWNSGMFAFSAETFFQELKKCEPVIFDAFKDTANGNSPFIEEKKGIKYIKNWDSMNESYKKTIPISIDNAIAEKTNKSCVVLASFDWDDVGSWDSFEKLFSKNSGVTTEVESQNSFVYSDIPVVLCGVKDLIIVIKNGQALVMKKGCSSLVKDAVKIMKDKGILEQ